MSTETKFIGERLPKPDWETARDLVSTQDRKGFVYLAKPGAEYAGKVVLMSETHLVQQVGKNSAVAHDLSKLDNSKELSKRFDNGEIEVNKTSMSIKYDNERGTAEVLTYNQQRADAVQAQAEKWAEQNITNGKSREAFLKHVQAFTQDMAKGKQPAKAAEHSKGQEQNKSINVPKQEQER